MLKTLAKVLGEAQEGLAELTPVERAQLEESWDVEHAYYSSALEGSKLDKRQFEILGQAAK